MLVPTGMSAGWTREHLWAEDDRRQRARTRGRLHVAFAAALLTAGAGICACYELYVLDGLRRIDTAIGIECVADADCTLTPALLTCCGECPALPPFEAVPRALLDDVRADCAPLRGRCEPPTCAPRPAGCIARAVCDRGRCRALASDACLQAEAR